MLGRFWFACSFRAEPAASAATIYACGSPDLAVDRRRACGTYAEVLARECLLMVVLITAGLVSKLSEMMHPPHPRAPDELFRTHTHARGHTHTRAHAHAHTRTRARVNFGVFLSPNQFAGAKPCLTSEQSITKATRDHQSWGMLEV